MSQDPAVLLCLKLFSWLWKRVMEYGLHVFKSSSSSWAQISSLTTVFYVSGNSREVCISATNTLRAFWYNHMKTTEGSRTQELLWVSQTGKDITIKLLIECFYLSRNTWRQQDSGARLLTGTLSFVSGENGGDNDVNIGHLVPQCGRSAAGHLKCAAYGVWSRSLVWFGAQDSAVYWHVNVLFGCVWSVWSWRANQNQVFMVSDLSLFRIRANQ